MCFMIRIAAIVLVSTVGTSAIGLNDSDHSEAALRQLHRATKSQRGGQHLLSLAALRTLRDPDLRPFFQQFSQHSEWAVQVHAVLGIAELSEDQTIDPWLVQQIAPTAREHVVAQALDDGLFQQEQIEALLKWPLLETSPRLLLLADLQLLTGTVNKEELQKLANNTDLTVAMFAALLSGDAKSIEKTTQILRRATKSDRSTALQRTNQLIRQYKLTSASAWLQALLEKRAVALTDQERYWTLYTLLAIDTKAGLDLWERAFPTEPERIDQVNYLLLLLESGIVPNTKHIERLKIDLDDPLLGLMVRAGNINRDPSKITNEDIENLVLLVEQGHRSSVEWAFRVVDNRLTNSQAESFYIPLATIPESTNPRRKVVAAEAFTNLIDISPESAWKILRAAKDDSDQQQLLLLAMLQISNDGVVNEATKLRRIGLNKADIMTLLLIARGPTPLQENDQEYLGIIAAGGGHISPALETQAAWLYLRRMGLADKALAAVRPQ
ncbi:MAG: hypothetical protein H8E83_08095 [Planctomycetes bacterium]|nr:hypothetical protein [Planctomycetota bacterium]